MKLVINEDVSQNQFGYLELSRRDAIEIVHMLVNNLWDKAPPAIVIDLDEVERIKS